VCDFGVNVGRECPGDSLPAAEIAENLKLCAPATSAVKAFVHLICLKVENADVRPQGLFTAEHAEIAVKSRNSAFSASSAVASLRAWVRLKPDTTADAEVRLKPDTTNEVTGVASGFSRTYEIVCADHR
jgi:hypothetical protein